jgi:nucleoside-diphosphate kinase
LIHFYKREAMQSTVRILAGAAGLTTAFVAGGFAKDKFNQVKFEKAVPILPKESLAEITKTKVVGAPFQLKAEAGAQAERTFIMIKPDGVQRGLVGEIVKRFEQKGFKLVAIRMMRPGEAHLREHYADLSARSFFPGLVSYMDSGPVVAMAWEGQGAVKTGRVMLGETNPAASKPGTIRGDYCIQVGRNICHGSDAVESAEHEIGLWFRDEDICKWTPAQEDWVLGNN